MSDGLKPEDLDSIERRLTAFGIDGVDGYEVGRLVELVREQAARIAELEAPVATISQCPICRQGVPAPIEVGGVRVYGCKGCCPNRNDVFVLGVSDKK